MSDQAYGRQIPLDGQGGKIGDNPQDDIAHLREGGQTNYKSLLEQGNEPFDKVAFTRPKFENRFLDIDIQPIAVACQEDRTLVVYDWVQKQYNVSLSAGGTIDTELDVVEDNCQWEILRVAMFGTATGFLQLFDGSSIDNSLCIVLQAGVAAQLGGVQGVAGVVMTNRTPLRLKATGCDASASISIGVWYKKLRWVWTPASDFPGKDYISEAPTRSH